MNVLGDQPVQHLLHVRQNTIQIEYRGLRDLPAAEGEQLTREGGSTFGAAFDFAQTLLQARALGLGSVLTTLHRVKRARIHEILGIPEGWDTAAIIPLGWPDRSYGPNRRPPISEVMMRDRWSE